MPKISLEPVSFNSANVLQAERFLYGSNKVNVHYMILNSSNVPEGFKYFGMHFNEGEPIYFRNNILAIDKFTFNMEDLEL